MCQIKIFTFLGIVCYNISIPLIKRGELEVRKITKEIAEKLFPRGVKADPRTPVLNRTAAEFHRLIDETGDAVYAANKALDDNIEDLIPEIVVLWVQGNNESLGKVSNARKAKKDFIKRNLAKKNKKNIARR